MRRFYWTALLLTLMLVSGPSTAQVTIDPSSSPAGLHQRWLWWDLSSFELREGGLLGDRLVFKVNSRSDSAPLRSPFALLTAGGRNAALADIYEAPLAEIAGRLNDYRRQALGGATARQQAYA